MESVQATVRMMSQLFVLLCLVLSRERSTVKCLNIAKMCHIFQFCEISTHQRDTARKKPSVYPMVATQLKKNRDFSEHGKLR